MTPYEQAEQDKRQMLEIFAMAYHRMGERTTNAFSVRSGHGPGATNRILGRMAKHGLCRSTYGSYEVKGEWHLTEQGWAEAGIEKPLWLVWAEEKAA